MPEALATLRGALAARYRVERELGRGGMAVVYLAHDLKHRRAVAIKVLHPDIARAVGAERFVREIGLAASFTHPHILPLHDSGLLDEGAGEPVPYYVMPYVAGESLRDRLRRERQLPLDDALRIARDVAGALAYAHAHGVVHRDIKPENILLEEGEAVVADFGIARAVETAAVEPITTAGLVLGTPQYMSPEQAAGDPALDGRADVYSLGCVLYEMLAGEPPFTGPTAQVVAARRLAGKPPSLRVVRPDVPPEVEAAVARAIAQVPAARFRDAADFAAALERARQGEAATLAGARTSRRHAGRHVGRHVRIVAAAGLLGAALAAAVALLRPHRAGPLDASLVAVAPFDAIGPGLELWREGVVDLLARDLDGAGPIRTVPPTTVVRRWTGRADPASAAELGRRTGAGLVVFGSVTGGADSVRLRATLLDAATGRTLQEVELRDAAGRIDRVTDTLTLSLLRELGRERPIGAFRRVGLSTTSLPALKAFLQGEQWLRRTQWDSAYAAYERAIAADTGFALALRRAGMVLGWTRTGYDSLSNARILQAAAHNRGLPPRDSLLIVGDSLFASLLEAGPMARGADAGWWPRARRAFATAELAVRRYPDDPESWYALGDLRAHIGPFLGGNAAGLLDAFDHAIALDSAFGPAYIHPVESAFRRGAPAVRRYLRPYLALGAASRSTGDLNLVARVLDAADRGRPLAQSAIDSTPTLALFEVANALGWWDDSAEVRVRVARAFAGRPPLPELDDPLFGRRVYMLSLLARGHLRAAGRDLAAMPEMVNPYLEAALLGGIPPASAAPVFAARLRGAAMQPIAQSLAWWDARRDSAALRLAARRADSMLRAPTAPPLERQRAGYVAAGAGAYLALLRGDSAAALRQLVALPDSLCPACYVERLTRVQLLLAEGRDREAAVRLRDDLPTATLTVFPLTVHWTLLRGRAAERLGDRPTAIDSYTWVAHVWRNADPELRTYVDEARAGLARLTAERS